MYRKCVGDTQLDMVKVSLTAGVARAIAVAANVAVNVNFMVTLPD